MKIAQGIVVLALVVLLSLRVITACAELTRQQAIDRAREYIKKAGLPDPNPIPPGWQYPAAIRATLTDSPFGFRVWDIQLFGDYNFKMDAQTGELVQFDHSRRTFELVHRLNRTGLRKIKTADEARKRCESVARAFGLPSHAILDTLTQRDSKGMISASYTEKPFGYPQFAGGNGMAMTLDRQDGLPTYVGSSWRTRFDPPNPRITAERALEIAKREYARIHQRGSGFHRGIYSPKNPPKLGYVTPNSFVNPTGPTPNAQRPTARLAWVVQFGEESVWIDAEFGRPLGAAILK